MATSRNDRPKTTGTAGKRSNGKQARQPVATPSSAGSHVKNLGERTIDVPENYLSPLRSGFEDVQIGQNRLVVRSGGAQPGMGAHMSGLSVTLKGETPCEIRRPMTEEPDSADGGAPSNKEIPVFSQTNHICPICGTHEMDNSIILRCGHQFCRRHLEAVQSRVRVNLCEEMANPVRFNVVCALCGDSFCYQGDALVDHHPTDGVTTGHFLPVHSRDVTTYLGPLKMDWQSSI